MPIQFNPSVSTQPVVPPSGRLAPKLVGAADFEREVLRAQGPVVVEFMSFACPHCIAAQPAVEAANFELVNRMKIVQINVPAEQRLAGALGIRATPTFVYYLNGQELGRREGFQPGEDLALAFNQAFRSRN